MRLGAALDLVPTLRASRVSHEQISVCEEELGRSLLQFSPRVEKARDVSAAPGVFWVDPSGLHRLYGGPSAWCRAVRVYFTAQQYALSVAVGLGRYPTYALAQHGHRNRKHVQVFSSRKTQFYALREVRLSDLEIEPKLVYELQLLGVLNVGQLLALDPSELALRLGTAAKQLYESLCDRHRMPIQARAPQQELSVQIEVSPPDDHLERLLFGVKSALHDLVALVSSQGFCIRRLHIFFRYERGGEHREQLDPATPSRDVSLFLELVRLRFSNLSLQSEVSMLRLEAETSELEGDQLSLFDVAESVRHGRPPRDPEAAERAIARLQAAFGEQSVQSFVLRDGHLPEAQYGYVTREARGYAGQFRVPAVAPVGSDTQKVRRLFSKPKRLHKLEGVVQLLGPYRISGGWWNRYVERDYYYGQTERGVLLWLYQDRVRNAWFWHGFVD